MSRLRARLAKSEFDRQVQEQISVAQRAIEQALQVCHTAKRAPGIEKTRAGRVARDLIRAQGALGRVGRLTPLYDLDDPDMMSEDERSRLFRERRTAEISAAETPEVVESEEGG